MRYLASLIWILVLSVAFVACGGEEAGCAEPAADAAGVWEMTATPIEDSCDGDLTPYTFWVTIMQDGNALTAHTPEGTLPGTICGDQVQISGSYSVEGGGTSTVNLALTVSADGNSVEGSDTWSWTYDGQSCRGSESLIGIRADARHSEVCEPLCAKSSECSIPWNCGQSCYFALAESARTSAECEDAFADLYTCVAGLSCEQIDYFLTGGDPCKANDFVRSVCPW
jgi:hypothetical protein